MKLKDFLNRQAFKLVGIGFGVAIILMTAGAMSFAYAEEPEFCGSCHAMEDHYASWLASTHVSVNCSECHLPNDALAKKLVAKAQTGFIDVYHQTVRDYPLQIQTTAKGKEYLRDNCLRCHEATIANTSMAKGDRDCTFCHRTLVHDI